MKTKAQLRKKLSSLCTLLTRAEDNYTESIGLRDEGSWARRMRQLQAQIDILNWVLEEEKPKPKRKKQ